ncbi:F-box protein At2g40925-like [Rhododendron vialii]|uniref:F-box protein At2g40925-like n=1 Tax=Rhododendron vialii TaxID=182163 RepID=UPI00265FB971|nr:F-box protein At2g40925-like [Rhododendron vialii]
MDFPKDIVLEILLRLPVKSVMRFKCVSSDWNDTISAAAFRKNYLSRHCKNAPIGFFYSCIPSHRSKTRHNKFISSTAMETRELESLDCLQNLRNVLASSKGLLLVSLNHNTCHVLDLVSKKHIKLPKPLENYPHAHVGFVCHEQETGGRKINGLSYKLVRVGGTLPPVELPDNEAKTREVETYSSKTGKWSKSTVMAGAGFYLGQLTAAKVIGGVFHWWDWYGKRVVAYNPDNPKGRVKLINLPLDRGIDGYGRKDFEGTQNRCLQFFIILGSIEVWVLKSKREGGSYLDDDEDVVEVSRWTLAHRIIFLRFERPYIRAKIRRSLQYALIEYEAHL